MDKAYIILADGQIFEGQPFGACGESVGEIVFTTGMGGYVETLTDPSYCGHIVVQTFPLIGNYGVMEADSESEAPKAAGYVVREWCEAPSNFRTEGDIDAYLKKHGIVGVCGVDTRELTRIIRENGAMNARIVHDPKADVKAELEVFKIRNAVAAVSCKEPVVYKPQGDIKYNVALMDYGVKRSMIDKLLGRGCMVHRLPFDTTAQQVTALVPDGVFLSSGPGDPAENTACIETIKALAGNVPMFGVCLGHQMLALALGGKTEKMKYGHRGENQPAKDIKTGRTYITGQNHGYAVMADSLGATGGELWFVNANDGTCEGIDYPELGAFSVQFHPEGGAGPFDTAFLFERFCGMMTAKGGANNAER